ncbi:hypothetical protein ABPG74_000800 [Tetrahymena malaccensis]
MKLLLGSLILIGLSLSALTYLSLEKPHQDVESIQDVKQQFEQYLKQFGIIIKNAEERIYRLKVFIKNVAEIVAHNKLSEKTYTQGINQFAHMTDEEFAETYLNLQEREKESLNIQDFQSNEIPESVDWRTKGVVTEVKNQGGCGSCYAFSAAGALEGLHAQQTGNLVSFSPQQVIDCSWKYHNHGCQGGFMDNVFNFVKDHGIVTDQDYPYAGHVHLFRCLKTTDNYHYTIKGHYDVQPGDCQGLQEAIAQQPVSVAIDARVLKKYNSGIVTQCGKKVKLNHGVLAVGYDADSLIIKNSWGTRWGEQGYFRFGKNNTCGVCEAASYPIPL